MPLAIDTDVLIELYKGNSRVLTSLQELIKIHPQPPAITFATFSEFLYGMLGKGGQEREKALLFLDKFSLLNTSRRSAERFSELKYALDAEGKPIPVLDILIASIVMESGMTLLTMDNHFGRIPGLDFVLL